MDVKYGSPRNVTEVNEQTAGLMGYLPTPVPAACHSPLFVFAWLNPITCASKQHGCCWELFCSKLALSPYHSLRYHFHGSSHSHFPLRVASLSSLLRQVSHALSSGPTRQPVGYPEQWLIIARLNYPTVAGKSALKSPHNKCHRLLEKLQH